MGMPSITKRDAPRPKLRVTFRSSTPVLAHDAQTGLDKVDGDDEESANRVEFNDCFPCSAIDRAIADNELDLARFTVALALGDFACEEEGFEIVCLGFRPIPFEAQLGRSFLCCSRTTKLTGARRLRVRLRALLGGNWHRDRFARLK